MGPQRKAAQAASQLRTNNEGEITQVDFPLLRVSHDLKIRFGIPPQELATMYGIRNCLPAVVENQVELVSPVDRVQYALFQVDGELDVFVLSQNLARRGWHPATTRILVHFGRYIPSKCLGVDVAALGSRYVHESLMKYPRLEHGDNMWDLVAKPYQPDRVAEPLYFLAWR